MSKDFIGYEALVEDALRGVVRAALARTAKSGLIGGHQLFLTFLTGAPAVDIPDFLRERYPLEMTIVLQNQYWNLTVHDDRFQVTLSFNKLPCELSIPFAALTAFADPSVKFGLQFGSGNAAKEPGKSPPPPPVESRAADSAAPAKALPADDGAGKVVSLDSLRKK